MPLYLDDEQSLLSDTARGLISEIAPVSHLRQIRDNQHPAGWCPEVWARCAEMGFSGLMYPEAQSGLGLGAVEAGIILQELGRNLSPSPFLSSSVGAAIALRHADSDLVQTWSQQLAAGTATSSLAIDEGSRHRPEYTRCQGRIEGDSLIINGTKTSVVQGHTADLILVLVRTSAEAPTQEGLTLVALAANTPGLVITPEVWADSSKVSRIELTDVRVPLSAIIGQPDQAWPIVSSVLDHMRTGAAAELVGLARAATDMTVAYLKERVQFDRIIGTFQALQHRAATVYAEVEIAYAAVLKAQQLLDDGDDRAHSLSMIAKAQAGWAATLAVQEGVQMHGGIGMTDEHDIGLFMKRARVLSTLYGHADELTDRLATEAGY